ncbi:hypothetical protein DAPPUDRAFT_262453 [Daphnia pulex]|uniref:Chromo domain-containing protein n=1 Tax=Daphnia pulex TaxID=6669 RepID=E9HN09_DAPPU|nr:hypothetical protein DAPPUDRAFT_262453 [Daphnia pulex]|eukprot:EFX66846.1 hypothetical protein DAPPUDRAFT_262453 [Daphnia pulex]
MHRYNQIKKNRKNISEDYSTTKPYKFESLLDQGLLLADRNQPVYLIKWKNYDDSYNSWEPESFFKNQQGILAKFPKQFLENGGDSYKKVTAEMVAHQYDHKGRSTRAGGSYDSQTNDNTPQTLPKQTWYNLRSVEKSTEQSTSSNTSMNEDLRSKHEDDHVMDKR